MYHRLVKGRRMVRSQKRQPWNSGIGIGVCVGGVASARSNHPVLGPGRQRKVSTVNHPNPTSDRHGRARARLPPHAPRSPPAAKIWPP